MIPSPTYDLPILGFKQALAIAIMGAWIWPLAPARAQDPSRCFSDPTLCGVHSGGPAIRDAPAVAPPAGSSETHDLPLDRSPRNTDIRPMSPGGARAPASAQSSSSPRAGGDDRNRPTESQSPSTPPSASLSTPRKSDGSNAAANRISARLPIDPATRDLRDRLPPDIPGLKRRLGLNAPKAAGIDMRGRTPSKSEIVNALAPK
jgi:hypothetical protein